MKHTKKKPNKNYYFLFIIFFSTIVIPFTLIQAQRQQETRQHAQFVQNTQFALTVYLHGIGNSGDATNPNSNSKSQKQTVYNQKLMKVDVYNSSNKLVLTKSDMVEYKADAGNYQGQIDMGNTLTQGSYFVKISSPGYLVRKITAAVFVSPHATVKVPAVTLVAGDFNGDNLINVLDWNILQGCYSDLFQPTFCDLDKTKLTDISGDFHVDMLDVNLFLREFAVQHGD